MADVVPIAVPSRSDLWGRVCLAKSILAHRPASPETARVALHALDGASITELANPVDPPVPEVG